MIQLQNSKNLLGQTAITNFLSGFVAKVRDSVSNFFCVKPSEKMNGERTESDGIYEIQNQIIEFTVTAKQPQKPSRQLKISVSRGELAGAKCVGNKISTMKAILKKNLTYEQYRFFRKRCLKRYDLAYEKSCIFIYFLFLRVMLELKQINEATFHRVYRLLQKSLKRSISWYQDSDGRLNNRKKIINSIILGEYLKLSYIPLDGGEYQVVARVFSSFFVNKTSLDNCLEKIESVIHKHLCLTDYFDDLR